MKERKIVEFGGVQFYLEQVSPAYTRLVPVSDPNWVLRHCDMPRPDTMLRHCEG